MRITLAMAAEVTDRAWNVEGVFMASKSSNDADQKEIFYHALYHHLAHWAAYVAMMGLLISIGFALSLSSFASNVSSGVRAGGVGIAILFAVLGAGYFIKGMDTYAGLVNKQLPESYLKDTQTFPHKMMIAIGVISALGCGVWDSYLLFMLSR